MTRLKKKSVGVQPYDFDAIRGTQAGREFYVVMCPLKIIPNLFALDEFDLSPELRAQRTLRKSRIPIIKNYILNNPRNYIFSSLTASVDGALKFFPSPLLGNDTALGHLRIDRNAKLLINDGQHRRKAIEESLKENPKLGQEMISVVFFKDNGLKRSQQMFSDLNKNVVKPTKSLNILYDHRNVFYRFIVDLTNSIDVFKDRVELEKTTISNRSTKAFTLNGISDASMKLLGLSKTKKLTLKEKKMIQTFWHTISKNLPQWQLLLNGDISAHELRKNYVNTHTNLLNSLGIVGKIVIQKYPDEWELKLRNLKKIDWSRESPEWEGRIIKHRQMQKQTIAIELAANLILTKCGISLSADRQKIEAKL